MAPLRSTLGRSLGRLLKVGRTDDLAGAGGGGAAKDNQLNSKFYGGRDKATEHAFTATGGVKFEYNSKSYHVFKSDGTFTTKGAATPTIGKCEIIIVGSGGGGRKSSGGGTGGGGGGAGGVVRVEEMVFEIGTHPVTVAATPTAGGLGNNSVFLLDSNAYPGVPAPNRSLTAYAGGRGARYGPADPVVPGGSGGGGGYNTPHAGGEGTQPTQTQGTSWTGTPGVTITQTGYDGGAGSSGTNQGGGGGGGGGGVGGASPETPPGSAGGAGGLAYPLPATFQVPGPNLPSPADWRDGNDEFYIAGGGGGGTYNTPRYALGGGGASNTSFGTDPRGGGGTGCGKDDPKPSFLNGRDNSGGGGGGTGHYDPYGASTGGSGLVLIAYNSV
mgnify:CR=1 FL=1